MTSFAPMPKPPYYAVIFANQSSDTPEGYSDMLRTMLDEAAKINGYIGLESSRNSQGFAVTVSYWQTEDAIKEWRNHTKHKLAQKIGRERWYKYFQLRVARIERQYTMDNHG